MAKEPVPGKVKTRLTPPLSHQLGSYLYEAMLADSMDILLSLRDAKKYLFIEPGDSAYFERYRGTDITIFPQSGNNLGEKMKRAAKLVFELAGCPLVIIGTDIPFLTPEIITHAVSMLKNNDVVIGPCEDGGYYLIAMRRFTHVPFQGIPWSSNEVLGITSSKLKKEKLTVYFGERLFDIDTAGDIKTHISRLDKHPYSPILRTRFSRAALKLRHHLDHLPGTGE